MNPARIQQILSSSLILQRSWIRGESPLIGFADKAQGLNIGCSHRRDEPIQSIIYLHPVANDGSNVADDDVEFNVKMLQEIAKDVMPNVVFVTTKWDRIPESERDSKQDELQNGLVGFYQEPFVQHDGTKWSAVSILSHAKRKTPKPLDLKNEIPSYTSAGVALSEHIDKLIKSTQEQEGTLRPRIRRAQRNNDRDTAQQLGLTLNELKATLARLDKGHADLDTPINREQAARDNEALEGAIKEQYDSATTNWKVEYNKLVTTNTDLRTKLVCMLPMTPGWTPYSKVHHRTLPVNGRWRMKDL